jgi:ankyrin repeat protein
MIASANGHTEVVKVLLERGANTELRNQSGKSAADVAANDEIRDLILSRTNKL